MGRNSLNRLLTLEQWSGLGYKVLKGSRHVSRNKKGVCQFNEDQVVKRKRRFLGWRLGDDPYDESDDPDSPMYDDAFVGEWGS